MNLKDQFCKENKIISNEITVGNFSEYVGWLERKVLLHESAKKVNEQCVEIIYNSSLTEHPTKEIIPIKSIKSINFKIK